MYCRLFPIMLPKQSYCHLQTIFTRASFTIDTCSSVTGDTSDWWSLRSVNQYFMDKKVLLRDKMNCTVGFVSCFCEFPWLALAAWQKAAGLVHQCNSEKTVSITSRTVHFVSWYMHLQSCWSATLVSGRVTSFQDSLATSSTWSPNLRSVLSLPQEAYRFVIFIKSLKSNYFFISI